MIEALFWVSIVFSVVSFGIFLFSSIERLRTLHALTKYALEHKPAEEPKTVGMQTRLQAGLVGSPEKVIDSFAKLTDSLSKAPLIVVALIGSLFFLLIALTAEGLACSVCNKHLPPPDNKKKEAAFITESERCTVVGFVEGTHDIEEPWQDSPTGCFAKIADRLRQQTPGILLIIGHSDLRGLKSRPRRIYASNLTLGYQRAMIVSQRLLHDARSGGTTDSNTPDLDKRVVLLSVGAGNVRSAQKVDLKLLAEDRVVDVVPLWNVMTEAGEIRH